MIIGKSLTALGSGGLVASIYVTGLSETDTVTATNGSKTKTGVWTQKPNPVSHGLPDGYTELEYIESSGTQYIDTEFKQNGTTKIVCDFQMVNQGTEQQGVFGSRPGASGRFTVFTGKSTGALQVDYDTEGTLAKEASTISGLNLNNRNTIEVSNSLIINGNTIKTVSAVSFTLTYNLFLFANNNVGTAQLPGTLKLYSCQIYDNGLLVRDFIPCKKDDGTVGMLDNVNSVFYGNAGTGVFTAGAEVPQTIGGFLIKPIRDFGTWTVTATDGVQTATQDVLVDVIAEYEIEMMYSKLYLYRDGDECEGITGGWTGEGYLSTSYPGITSGVKNDDNFTVTAGTSQNCGQAIGTSSSINKSGYTKLKIVVDVSMSAGEVCYFHLQSAKTFFLGDIYELKLYTAVTKQEYEIDISSFPEELYLAFVTFYYNGTGANRKITCHKVWLEK